MAEAAVCRRLETAVALLGLTALLSAGLIVLDAARFHASALVLSAEHLPFGDVHLGAIAMLLLVASCAGGVSLGATTALRVTIDHHRLLRRLDIVGHGLVGGREVTIVRGAAHVAFCAGLLRPRIYVSEQTLASLGAEELRAIVAHEAHHADRRDPLRLVLAAALTAVLGVVPGFAAMRRRHALLAELAADAAAERTVGGRAPLAAALLAFDEGVRGSIAPERVDRLLGTHQPASFSPVLLAVAAAALLVTAAVAVVWALVPSHPDLPISSLAFCFAALCVIASPAWLVARRLGR